MSEQERQASLDEGPPTVGKAVGAVSDVVSDVATLMPVVGEEAIIGKVMGGKIAKGIGVAAVTKTQRVKRWNELLAGL